MSKKTKSTKKKIVKKEVTTEGQKAALEKMEKQLDKLDGDKKIAEEKLLEIKNSNEELNKIINNKKIEIKELEANLKEIKKDIEKKNNQIEQLKIENERNVKDIKDELSEKEKTIQILTEQKNDLMNNIQQRQDEVNKANQEARKYRLEITNWEEKFRLWRKVLQSDLKFKILFLVEDTGQKTLEEISKTVGMPVQYINRIIKELEDNKLVKVENNRVKLFLG